jgi:hypothetical protein
MHLTIVNCEPLRSNDSMFLCRLHVQVYGCFVSLNACYMKTVKKINCWIASDVSSQRLSTRQFVYEKLGMHPHISPTCAVYCRSCRAFISMFPRRIQRHVVLQKAAHKTRWTVSNNKPAVEISQQRARWIERQVWQSTIQISCNYHAICCNIYFAVLMMAFKWRLHYTTSLHKRLYTSTVISVMIFQLQFQLQLLFFS